MKVKASLDAVTLGYKLCDFWNEQSTWSQETFGSDSVRGPNGPLEHCEKECREARENPKDIKEYADIGILLMDATRRAGFTLAQLIDAMYEKLQENKKRDWPKCSEVQYREAEYDSVNNTYYVLATRDNVAITGGYGRTSEEALEECKRRVNSLPVEHIRT